MLDQSQINPYVRVAMNSVMPAGGGIKRRIIFDYELIYLSSGSFTLTYNGTYLHCEAGQFIFIRPGIPHSFSNIESDLIQPHIHFDITHTENSARVPVSFKDLPALTDEEKSWIREDVFSESPENPLVSFSEKQKALKLFYKIISSETSALSKKAELIRLIEMLINDNFRNVFEKETRFFPIEAQVKDYIDAGQGLSAKLDDLAKHFSYSKCYLDHCFGSRYGIGIMKYRNEKRMQTAKEMLKRSTVSEVSEKLGFSSIYAFSRAFKNRFGVSPNEIKKPR
ncbi:MAG: helix-turn-helix domain-containing protein [Clostridia bacterium]|nr:helix-turn-helix domain-containing protein [Clostridia bacterium]